MEIRHMKKTEQSDYRHGCLQIMPTCQQEAFELGMIFANFIINGVDAVKYKHGTDKVAIRVPLNVSAT